MSEPLISLRDVKANAEFVRRFIEGDSSQAGGFLDEFSAAIPALVEAVEAAYELAQEWESLADGLQAQADQGLLDREPLVLHRIGVYRNRALELRGVVARFSFGTEAGT